MTDADSEALGQVVVQYYINKIRDAIYGRRRRRTDSFEESDAELGLKFLKMSTNRKVKRRLDKGQELSDSQNSALCTTSNLNVRATPCTNGRLVTTLTSGTQVSTVGGTQTACGHTWVNIRANGITGWAAQNWLRSCPSSGGSASGSASGGNSRVANAGRAASQFALQQVGKCYSQDVNLRRGPRCFDCSGLVNVAWGNQGFTVPWTTHGYPSASNMMTVSPSQVQPGDILWRSGHVGMFVGNGEVVEAANSRLGVIKSRFANWRYTAIYRPK